MMHKLTPKGPEDNDNNEMETPSPVPPAQRMPVDIYSMPIAILAVLAVVYTLHWAQAVFIPLMLGVMISYALSAPVNLMQKWHIPRAFGAALLLLIIVASSSYAVYSMSDDAGNLIESLPRAAQKLRQTQAKQLEKPKVTMEKVQQAATQIEKAANESGSPAPEAPRGVTRVQVEKPQINVKDYLWMGTKGAFGLAGQITMVLFLAYFIMVSDDTFRRKLVRITGPTLSKKKITLQVLDEITEQIQRYLLVQVFTSILVGIVTWLVFLWIGLENAAIWGIAACVFNTIPYIGPVLVTGGMTLVAFLQFGTIGMALTIGSLALLITSLEGYLLTPWLTGRASRMSPLVVFVGVLFWGWLWGVWGLLLGVPIIMIIKAICDRVEDLQPIGELLGD